MKALLIGILLATATVSNAGILASLTEAESQINISTVKKSIVLGENKQKDVQVRAVLSYLGQSTDVSPRYELFVTYFNGGEMNNTKTAFSLGKIWELKETKRISGGIYELTVLNANLEKETIRIDTVQAFIDDANLEINDFEDPYFESTISVTKK